MKSGGAGYDAVVAVIVAVDYSNNCIMNARERSKIVAVECVARKVHCAVVCCAVECIAQWRVLRMCWLVLQNMQTLHYTLADY